MTAESIASLTLLVVSDEEPVRELVRAQAEDVGLRVRMIATGPQALPGFERHAPDLAVADLAMPSLGGIEFVQRAHAGYPDTPLIVLTEFGAAEAGREALKAGAADFAARPFDEADLRAKLERVARAVALGRENRVLREQLSVGAGFRGLVGASSKMQAVYQLVEKAGRSQSPVLIQGETGTGKELVARSIHFLGPRKNGPFVPVDCTALVPTLVESELFGFVKGAFTGAVQSKRGLIEAASSGTLFLDEIGEFPLEMQPKLLRVLQEKQVRPVGATASAEVDVRVLAATNRNLQEEVDRGRFRQDLFFRLNVVPIRLPPLRERKSDIPLIVTHFLERYATAERPTPVVAEDAMARLVAYDWPGNVRELENAIARALALNSGPVIRIEDLPTNLQAGAPARLPLEEEVLTLTELERRAIYRALRQSGGDKLAAARLLGIGKTTLYRKLKQYEEH
ncbi:MAG TPA: sigma-54 dependent transcriptional regulator [Candidatus Acidoferrales bacterium]|nr:sigma-54 dependent transcriptional regulator [Candidatus Acidoferrales bacterium]